MINANLKHIADKQLQENPPVTKKCHSRASGNLGSFYYNVMWFLDALFQGHDIALFMLKKKI
ncbi:MAG: hypothetical protein JW841_09915 [Deltaproteobacteria bacterium]|nr:hypothetical protein [Deltaproteobacteria bacterium]